MTTVWGHRGAYAYAPENTLTGFQMAVDMGADGVEFDIQMTKDGEIVVIHDETVDRTSDGTGWVKDFTLVQLKRLNVNKRGLTPPRFMEIPTLAEVFDLLAATRLTLNVELKTGIVFYEGIADAALALAARFGLTERVLWSSFNHYSLARVKAIAPDAKIALLCGSGILATGEQCEKTGAYALHPYVRQLRYPGLVADCHARGVRVHTWTVNEPEDLRFAVEQGVDAVMTNYIDRARDAVGVVQNTVGAAQNAIDAVQNTVDAAQNTVDAAQNAIDAVQNTVGAVQNTVGAARA